MTWASIYILLFLTSFNIYYTLHLTPSDDMCASHGKPWTPVAKGLDYTWQMFPALTFTTKSKYFGDPVEDADVSWREFLPGKLASANCESFRNEAPISDIKDWEYSSGLNKNMDRG